MDKTTFFLSSRSALYRLSSIVDFSSIEDVKCLRFASTLLVKSLYMFSIELASVVLLDHFKVSKLKLLNPLLHFTTFSKVLLALKFPPRLYVYYAVENIFMRDKIPVVPF